MDRYQLPHYWKIPGWILIAAGAVLSVIYIWFDFRFTLPVFAIFSYYMEMKFLATFPTNFADELVLLTLLSGFFMVVFSKEKPEEDQLLHLKARAMFKALFYNTILLFAAILFVYGQGFIFFLVLNLFSVFILYLVFLQVAKRKQIRNSAD